MVMVLERSEWQSEARRCGVVLREVFAWLDGRDLARAGATCRAWRRAASEPLLWRRLLLSECRVDPYVLHHLHNLYVDTETVSWRQEYVTACSGWMLEARHTAAGGATLLHAALSPSHRVLALGGDDASLALWRNTEGSWREVWRSELRARGWAAVARIEWARRTPRLLLAGPRALINDWELMVLHIDDDYSGGTVASRVRCSAGAAGCWADADGDAFLSLELRLLGPGLACTTVRLNAATQETQSEYAGVTAPLLRIFNEDRAHVTHVVVASLVGDGQDERRVLVAGTTRRLGTWPVVAPRPPPLLVGAPNELAERVRRYRERAAAPEGEPPEPDEDSVRALCAAPDREYRLSAPLVGLALDDSARWVWAACSDASVLCLSVPSLEPQFTLRTPAVSLRVPIHYVQPTVSEYYVASPEGGYSPLVWVWSLRSGAAAQCGGRKARRLVGKRDITRYLARPVIRNGYEARWDIGDVNDGADDRDHNGEDNGDMEYGVPDEGEEVSDERENNEQRDELIGDEERGIEHGDEPAADEELIDDEGETREVIGDQSGGDNVMTPAYERDMDYKHEPTVDEELVDGERDSREVDGYQPGKDSVMGRAEVLDMACGDESAADEGLVDNEGESRQVDGYQPGGDSVMARAEVRDMEHGDVFAADEELVHGEREGRDDDNGPGADSVMARDEIRDMEHGDVSAADEELVHGERERRELDGDQPGGQSVMGRADEPDGSGGGEHPEVSVRGAEDRREAHHLGTAVCALLPRHDPDSMLVLASDTLYVWRRRAPLQSSSSLLYE